MAWIATYPNAQHGGRDPNQWAKVIIWVPDNVTVTKYKPPANPVSIIGIVAGSASLVHLAYDNATGLAATLTTTIFDTTTRADSAHILLTNATGSEKIIRGAVIRAKAITKLSGTEGFIHDKYVDYESIANNGELKMEIGNDFICTFAQVNKLADYHWKNSRTNNAAVDPTRRHIYTVSFVGMLTYFEPGEWYTLDIGSAGTAENISSIVEVYSVRNSLTAQDMGITSVAFREIYQNWTFDSNEVARSIASGKWNKAPGQLAVTVASSTYLGVADYYCDGTADDVEINAAIVYLNSKGGGQLQFTDGTYNVAAAVNQSFNNIVVQGMQNTIIKKNCNDYAWKIQGTAGTYITSGKIQNIRFTRDSADTNAKPLLLVNYAKSIVVDTCICENAYDQGFAIDYCTGCTLINCTSFDGLISGVFVGHSTGPVNVISSYCYGNNTGIYIDGGYANITNCKIENHTTYGIDASATALYPHIAGNTVINNGSRGINVTNGCYHAAISDNMCQFNGKNLIDNANCESATPPATYGEVANTLTQCTFARSNAQARAGTYSYLFTKIVAAGTAASAYLTDNVTTTDMHGMFAGHEYTFDPWVYIPGGGMTGTNVSIVIDEYYSGAWHPTVQACANTYDAWQQPTVTLSLNALTTGFRVGFLVAAAEALNTIFYADDIEHFDTNPVTNVYSRNFYDSGTKTQVG